MIRHEPYLHTLKVRTYLSDGGDLSDEMIIDL